MLLWIKLCGCGGGVRGIVLEVGRNQIEVGGGFVCPAKGCALYPGRDEGSLDHFRQGNGTVRFAFQNVYSGCRKRITGGQNEGRQTSVQAVAVA